MLITLESDDLTSSPEMKGRQKSEAKRFGWFGSWLLFLVHGSVMVLSECKAGEGLVISVRVRVCSLLWACCPLRSYPCSHALRWRIYGCSRVPAATRSNKVFLLSVRLIVSQSVCLPPLTAPPLRPIIPVYFGLMRAGWDLLTISAGIWGLCILYILSAAVISSRAANRAGRYSLKCVSHIIILSHIAILQYISWCSFSKARHKCWNMNIHPAIHPPSGGRTQETTQSYIKPSIFC